MDQPTSQAACFIYFQHGLSGSLSPVLIARFLVHHVRCATLVNTVTMILRVRALYNRSRFIISILLTFYAIEVILGLIPCIQFSIQSCHDFLGKEDATSCYRQGYITDYTANTVQLLDFSFCVIQVSGSSLLGKVLDVVQIALGALMCLFVIIKFVKESLQMYKVTKRWELNRYMKLLVREGMFYFLTCVHAFVFRLLHHGANDILL